MNVYAFGDGGVSENVRLFYPLSNMEQDPLNKMDVIVGSIHEGSQIQLDKDAIYIFSRPMTVLEFAINKLKGINNKIIVDIDDNFWAIPKTHVAYNLVGPESLNLRSLERIMKLAKIITVSTEPLAEFLVSRGLCNNPIVIPNVCNSDNKYNCYNRSSKHLRFGFSGTMTHREDFKLIFKPLKQFIMETENTQIVIAVDPEIYKMFRDIPEQKKLFVPSYPYNEYPLQISYFDVMLIPLINDVFNKGKSDIKILDALVNAKPFIASDVTPYSPYKDSGAGLVIPNTEDDWYSALNYMLSEKNRKSFSDVGVKLAKKYHVSNASKVWKKIIQGVAQLEIK